MQKITETSMRIIPTLLALAALAFAGTPAIAGDAAAGKVKSAVCAACHGANGISNNDLWPNLAGQKEGYLALQLKAFREGTRKNPLMSPMAANLSDADIADLAAYFSSLGK
jgi:cytochrome c553